jgi:hypothetical protein
MANFCRAVTKSPGGTLRKFLVREKIREQLTSVSQRQSISLPLCEWFCIRILNARFAGFLPIRGGGGGEGRGDI